MRKSDKRLFFQRDIEYLFDFYLYYRFLLVIPTTYRHKITIIILFYAEAKYLKTIHFFFSFFQFPVSFGLSIIYYYRHLHFSSRINVFSGDIFLLFGHSWRELSQLSHMLGWETIGSKFVLCIDYKRLVRIVQMDFSGDEKTYLVLAGWKS